MIGHIGAHATVHVVAAIKLATELVAFGDGTNRLKEQRAMNFVTTAAHFTVVIVTAQLGDQDHVVKIAEIYILLNVNLANKLVVEVLTTLNVQSARDTTYLQAMEMDVRDANITMFSIGVYQNVHAKMAIGSLQMDIHVMM